MWKRFIEWLSGVQAVEVKPVTASVGNGIIHVQNYRVDLATDDGVVFAYVNGRMVGGFPDETWAMEAACYRLEQLHYAKASQTSAA